MQSVKSFVLFVALLFIGAPSFAQMTADPTTWKPEVKKKNATEYELVFHLTLKAGWHIWSLKPGGDGFQIVPTFVFAPNPKVKMKGNVSEKGKATTSVMEGVDGKVTYLSGNVDYTQTVTAPSGTKVNCTLTYQVCDDKMCLAPKDKDFTFSLP